MRKRDDLTFVVGTVSDIDTNRYTMSVDTFGGYGPLNNIPITQPFAGTSSYIGAMPEIGSIVVLANQYNFVYPLCYLPNYTHALDAKNVRAWPEGVDPPQSNEMFFKFPKLMPGYVALSSSEGVEAMFGEKFSLRHMTDELIIDGRLDQIVATALNNYMFSGGVWRNAGVVSRNQLKKSITEEGHYAKIEPFKDGTSRARLRLSPDDGRMFTEYLVEVEDMTIEQSPRNEVNSTENEEGRNPVAVLAMGNLIGNNAALDNYAKMLRVGLFNSADDNEGQLTFEPLAGDDALKYGMAISLFSPNRRNPEMGSFIGMDKEGHFYQYVPSATCGGLGKGRSISIVAKGSKKEIFGMESKYGTSWEMAASGGIRWVVGAHNERDGSPYSHRSIDIRAKSSAFYMYGGTDPKVYDFQDSSKEIESYRKYGKIEKMDGHERHEVDGNRETIVRSSELVQIEGMRRESVAGAYSLNVGQDMNIAVTSVFSEKVTKEKQETFGSRVTTITSGDTELEVKSIVGSIKETITKVGSRITKVTTGNIEEAIKVGSRKTSITTGDSSVKIKVGGHSVSTKSGNLSLVTKLGTFEAKSSVKSSMVASLAGSANVEGGSISLKSKEKLMGGIVTDKTHFDYITGAPLVGSKTVKASGLPG